MWRTPLNACLAALLFGALCGQVARAAEAVASPTVAELRAQSKRCLDLLRRSVLDFYLPQSVDLLNGGYMEDHRDGRFVGRCEKFLTLQARQIWFFSTLAAEDVDRQRCLDAAFAGYVFLDRNFRDHRLGGYFSKTDEFGAPTDRRKHLYHNSFALYALVAYHQVSRDRTALTRAQELFRVIDQRAHDDRNGGYTEFFHPDWRPVTEASESTYVGAIGTKTYNTHLHLLESFSALYKVWPDPLLRMRLEELMRINTTTVQHPQFRCNLDGWQPNWVMVDAPRNLRASYGHDVECVWLVLEGARSLRVSTRLYRSWAESLAAYSLEHGYDTDHGGFHYAGPLGEAADDTRKEWWVQAEGLLGMLELYRLTGDARYYARFKETLDFIERHQIAPDGGWWATRAADGSATGNTSRTGMWQGAYHSGRALLFAARILSEINPATN
jgi:mannobiose 2-epimerase